MSDKSVGICSDSRAHLRKRYRRTCLERGLEHLTPSAQKFMCQVEAIIYWTIPHQGV